MLTHLEDGFGRWLCLCSWIRRLIRSSVLFVTGFVFSFQQSMTGYNLHHTTFSSHTGCLPFYLTILSKLASVLLSIHLKTLLIKLTDFLPNSFILAVKVGLVLNKRLSSGINKTGFYFSFTQVWQSSPGMVALIHDILKEPALS